MSSNQSTEKLSFASLLDESNFGEDAIEGRVVTGIVVALRNDYAIVDVGLKAEGLLNVNDIKALKGVDTLSIGDTLEVFVERFEDRNGEPILSIEKARREAVWKKIEVHMESGSVVEGFIIGRTNGGFSVDISGTTAFLPGSQVDLRIVKDITPLLNVPQPFKVLKMDKTRNNIVVSRRAVLETARNEARSEIISKLEEGMIIQGIVKNTTDYGVFVDIGGIDGLLHVTDMSWKRVASPAEMVKVGDSVQVQILKFNKDTGRISLGMKQLVKTPWEGVEQRYIIGDRYNGRISNVTDYGAFVELEDCIEGMIYITELSWLRKNVHPSKLVSIGDEVEVVVLDVNPAKRKISLGLKQCQENPWRQFAETHPIGTKLEGVVKNITEFGIFVGVTELLDGMVHISDVSWNSGNKDDKSKDLQKGQQIEVIVLDVNPEKERISLGIKQLENDPRAGIELLNDQKGETVLATVKEVHMAGVDVTLENGLPGFIKKENFSSDRMGQKSDVLSVGDKIEAMILGVDKIARVVNLSIRGLEIKREKEDLEKFGSSQESGARLGDILGLAMKEKEDSQNQE
ncbi:MAG: 30S ribosomal protein S1 [Holosporales bacterium]|jgi:small subunit ribosomal protein S1|nr:30S ribosomal protein S1 [Holosporales bacterium]